MYHGWYEMGNHIEKTQSYAPIASEKHGARWAYAHAAIFAAAYVVDPEFVGHDQASCEEVRPPPLSLSASLPLSLSLSRALSLSLSRARSLSLSLSLMPLHVVCRSWRVSWRP